MTRKLRSVVFAAGVLGAAVAFADDADVQSQIKALQDKVSQLEQQQKQQSQTALDAVNKDASSRGELMQVSGPDYSMGYDKGLFFQSSDKKFSLKPGILLQTRYATAWREDVKHGGTDDDTQSGWEIRRLKLYATGNLYTPNLSYGIQLATDSSNNNQTQLDDIYVQYQFATHNAVKVGQYKGPFNREELVSDAAQLLVERSMLNQVLGGGQTGPRSQGVSFIGGLGDDNLTKDPFRYEVMFNDGDGTNNTNFSDTNVVAGVDTRPDWGAIGRVDYKFTGDWKDLQKFTAKGTADPLFVLGGGVATSGNTGNTNYRGTIDALYQGMGGKLSMFGAIIGSYTDIRTATAADDSRFDWGAVAQVGYLVAPEWEPFARADFVKQDSDFVSGDELFPEFTIGVNRFFGPDGAYGNRCKLALDVSYLPSGSPITNNGADELTNNGKNEVVVRVQFQFQL